MKTLKIFLFGAMSATLGDETVAFRSAKVKALLAYLAVQADQPHSRESLATLFWGDYSDQKARENLRSVLAQLRGSLGNLADTLLTITPQTVQFNLLTDQVWVDANAFTELWQASQAYPVNEWWRRAVCIRNLQNMTALYKDEFVTGLRLKECPEFEDWQLLHREQYHQQMLVALTALAEHELALSSPMTAITYARRQLALESWQEAAHRQLMRAHLQMGQIHLARQQYETCAQVLKKELGLEPDDETRRVFAQIVEGGDRSSYTSPPIQNRPPAGTPFIGRQKILTRLLPLLLDPDYRLLTLTGVGGAGKTRLALEIGARVTAHFRDGAWFVPLAGIAEPSDEEESVAETIAIVMAQALNIVLAGRAPARPQLLAALKGRESLLILDNFEHLQAGVELVGAILAQCPAVKLLVTSRNRLNLQSGVHVPLMGLPVGEPDRPAEAEQLFRERAERVDFTFTVGREERESILKLCQFLEGVPLSIELAAGWIDRRSLPEIVETVAHDLDRLATTMADVPERQRSMRAVFEGSWRLLKETEQQILARLAVFRGGFQLEAAQEIVGADKTVLANLVEHFLLREGANDRFELHELLRQFALEKLAKMGSLEEVQELHSHYYLNFIAQHETTMHQENWLRVRKAMELDLGNIRQAWEWAVAHRQVEACQKSLDILSFFFWVTGLSQDAAGLFQEAGQNFQEAYGSETPAEVTLLIANLIAKQASHLNRMGKYDQAIERSQQATELLQTIPDGNPAQTLALVSARYEWANSVCEQGKYETALALFEQALQESAQLDISWKAHINSGMAINFARQGQFHHTRTLFEEALDIYQQTDDYFGQAKTLYSLGFLAHEQGRFADSTDYYEQSLGFYEKLGMVSDQGHLLNALGMGYTARSDYVQAQRYYAQAKKIADETYNRHYAGYTRHNLGLIASHLGDYPRAKACYEEALKIYEDIGDRREIAWGSNNLGLLYQHLGDYKTALPWHQDSLQTAQSLGAKAVEGIAWCRLGQALSGLGQGTEADEAFTQAFTIQQELGQKHWAMESLAGRIRLALARGDLNPTRTWCEDLITYLEARGSTGMREPLRNYLTCYSALEANHDPRAANWLETTYHLLQDWAEKIEDVALRHLFLTNIPYHAEIVSLWDLKTGK